MHYGFTCKFVEALFDEPRAGKSAVNPLRLAAALCNRCNSGIFGNLLRRLKPITIGSHSRPQTGSKCLACARKTVEYFSVRLFTIDLIDSLIKSCDSINQHTQLRNDGLNHQN